MKPTHLNNNNLPHSPALTRLLKRPVSLFALLTLALVTGLTACSPDTTTTSGRDRAKTCSTDCSADGKVCRAGKCVTPSGPITCSATQTPCGSGTQQTCCESNQTCSSNGQCVPKQQGDGTCASPCPDTETCSNGQCVPKQQGDGVECKPACKGTTACVNGQCVDKSGSDKCDPACEGASVCKDGLCVAYDIPCKKPCGPTQTCKAGVCSDNDGCSNCNGPDEACLKGQCVTRVKECDPSINCGAAKATCIYSACIKECEEGCEDGEFCDGNTGTCKGDAKPHCVGVTCSDGQLCQSECKTVGGCTEDSGICVANPGTTCAALDDFAEVLKLTYGQEMTLYGDFNLNKADGHVSNCAYNGTGSVHHSVKFVVEKPTKLDIEKKDGKFSYALYKGCSDTEEMVCTKNIGITEKLLLPGTYYLTLQTETPEIKWKLRLSATSFEPECEKFDQYYCKGNTLEACSIDYNRPSYTEKTTIGACPSTSQCQDANVSIRAHCTGLSCEAPIVLNPNPGRTTYPIQGDPNVFDTLNGVEDASCHAGLRVGKSIIIRIDNLTKDSTVTFNYDSAEVNPPLVMFQEAHCGGNQVCVATNSEYLQNPTSKTAFEYVLPKATPTIFMTIVRDFYTTNPPLGYNITIDKR